MDAATLPAPEATGPAQARPGPAWARRADEAPPAVRPGSAIALYARATEGHEARLQEAVAILQAAARDHAGRIVFTTSLGAEDMVVTDLIARHRLPIPLATLDTGMLPAETLALLPRIREHWGLAVEVWQAPAEAVVSFVAKEGPDAMRRSVALRQACCALRKLEPLARALAGRTGWVTGLRREQGPTRAELPTVDTSDPLRVKFNPLAGWSQADVWHHISRHGLPYNALHDAFFPSIGCQPCTRAVAVGEDIRAGRWWWEQADTKECGLHGHAAATAAG